MGGANSLSAAKGVLRGCQAGPATEPFTQHVLTPVQNELVATLTEIIIPETDTPGARAARVNEFIDVMLAEWYPQEERDQFLRGLATVEQSAQDIAGVPFLEATFEEQVAVVDALEREAIQAAESSPDAENIVREPEDAEAVGQEDADELPLDPPFFNTLKSMTLLGYYTSEIGASQELGLMPMGRYDGSVPYAEIGRAWS
jgi:hypothetical protein